ncbi:MAG: Gfo/Idh/MocA family oxidoreductase [Bacteroidales bacterium]|nr:Gfo/Idh/MocA family oxidoreductase [Bacteroidales bacterium]
MKPVKIAISSLTHGHTRKYFQTLHENPKLEWVAVSAESDKVRDVFLKSGYNVPCYMDEKEMLDAHPDIEAVVMASANNRHIHQFREYTQRGIHILCMKIPTFDMEEYDEIIRLVEESGIVCQIELEMHYNPVVERVKKLLAREVLGTISGFNATNITLSPVWAFPWQGVPEESYGKRIPLCEGNKRFRGGALSDHPHVFDMIRWLTNSEFDYIYAEVGPNLRTDIEVEDILLVNGKMKNGVSFLFDPSWSRLEERLEVPGPGWEIYPKRMEVNFSVSGEKGVMLADCFGPNVYHNGAPNDRYTVQYTYFDEWIGMMDEFIYCIRNKDNPKINLKWHKKTIEAMNACYESIYSGQPIYL